MPDRTSSPTRPGALAIFLFTCLVALLMIGAVGARVPIVLRRRFARDFTPDALGSCLVLFVGAAWGLAQEDANSKTLGGVLAILCGYLLLGGLFVGVEKPSVLRWVLYVLAGAVLAAVLAFALLFVSLQGRPISVA